MTATVAELLERLAETDECADLEVKRSGTELGKSALETISAFCNEPGLGGGTILFGVAEDAETRQFVVHGIRDPKKLEQEISSLCATAFNRSVRPRVWTERVDHRYVVAATITEASPHEKPVYLRSKGIQHGTYRRIGSTDQRCTEDDLRVLFRAGDATAYEDTLVPDAELGELEPETIATYRRQLIDVNPATELRDASLDELVQAVGGARRDGGKVVPTVAGVLLFGSRLLLRRVFPQHRVDYIRVPGTEWVPDAERRYQSIEIRDPLLAAFRRAYRAIVDDLPRSFALEPGSPERRDQPAVPETVIREALVNAITHRDYRIPSAIQVIHYRDRIEIRNPGHSLVGDEQFGQPGSYPRNPRIADVFREMRLAENKGTGIQAMRRAMKGADLELPVFNSNTRTDRFATILWFHSLLDDAERRWLHELGVDGAAPGQRIALVLARKTGFVTNSMLRDMTSLDPLQARRELALLRDAGLISKQGDRGGAYYVLTKRSVAAWTDVAEIHGRGGADRGEPGSDRGELESDRGELGSDRGELGSDRGELESDRGELESDRGELESDRGELGVDSGAHEGAREPDRPDLPAELAELVASLGARPRQPHLRNAIVQLCTWRPLRAVDLGAYLQIRPDKLTERHLAPMAAAGTLVRTHPESPTHPEQAYRAAQPPLPGGEASRAPEDA